MKYKGMVKKYVRVVFLLEFLKVTFISRQKKIEILILRRKKYILVLSIYFFYIIFCHRFLQAQTCIMQGGT